LLPAALNTPPPTLTPGRPRLIAGIVACALFMQNLDGTVIATALPAMARTFHVDPVHMNIALTAYLFAIAAFIPASGWMADRFGTRRVFAAAIATFTAGSILCGLSGSLWALIAARVIQGAGGAMMLPVGRLVILRSVPKDQLIGATAWVTTPALVGPVIGPPVGGFIVTYLSWHWIFYINVPVGLAGFILVRLFIADTRQENPGRFDFIGLALSALCLGGFMGVLELAGASLVPSSVVIALGACSLLAGALYWARARSQPRALLDFSLLRVRTFMISVAAGSLFRFGVGAVPFLLPLMLQVGFGRSAVESGIITFASAAGAIFVKPAATSILRRFGFRATLAVNGLACSLSLAAYATFGPTWPLAAFYAVLGLGGVLRSLQFTAYNSIAYADVPASRMSAATTLYSTLQQTSLTVGIPVSAGILRMLRTGHAAPQPHDFALAFLAVAGISALAVPLVLRLPRGAGAEMSGNRNGA
jgi:EmrB/QacA subfamily drug resistance transporter